MLGFGKSAGSSKQIMMAINAQKILRKPILKTGILSGVVQTFDSKPTKSLKITDLAPSLMSKKRDKNTKDSRDRKDNKHRKRCKSKKTDDQKWGPLQDTTRNTKQEEGAKAA